MELHQIIEEFVIPMKLMWLGYLVYSLVNIVIKLCIETGLSYSMHISRDLMCWRILKTLQKKIRN